MTRPDPDLSARVEQQVRALVEHEEVARVGEDPEGVHQMRVSVRRLRAAVYAAAPAPGFGELQAELRWLGGVLGPVRDLDVLLGRVRDQSADFPPVERAAVERLLAGLVADRRQARRRMLETFRGARYAALLRAVTGLRVAPPRTGATDDGARDTLLKVIARSHRKLRRDAIALGDDPQDDDLHALRIRGKRLRYAAELAERSGGGPVRHLIRATRAFQDVLGDHQDAAVAEEELRRQLADLTELADIDHAAVFVAGRLVERERAVKAACRARWRATFDEVDRQATALLAAPTS